MTKLKVVEQLIGEGVLFSPIILVGFLLSIMAPMLMSILVFTICKFAYTKPFETWFHIDTKYCVVLTYGMFVNISLIYLGLGICVPILFNNQPMIVIILSLGSTCIWAYAGDMQYEDRLQKAELERVNARISAWNTFRLAKYCNYEDMLNIAQSKGLNTKQIKVLKLYYCDAASWAKINAAMAPWSESTIRKFLKQATEDFKAT